MFLSYEANGMVEGAEQKDFVAWFRAEYPEYAKCLRVSLRGLNFGSGRRAAQMINHIKSQGSVEGESDLVILLKRGDYGCLVIEHKGEGMTHEVTKKQGEYLAVHNSLGNLAVSTRGIRELKSVVKEYLES